VALDIILNRHCAEPDGAGDLSVSIPRVSNRLIDEVAEQPLARGSGANLTCLD